MFKAGNVNLEEILKNSEDGALQLPDFQRSWVWDDEQICSLLASVSRGFPIGIIMTLKSGSEIKFKPRPIEGVQINEMEPEEYLLDGQQRITSLYQASFSKDPVNTKDNRNRNVMRHYYIDMRIALDETRDREEAIISVPEDRTVRLSFGRKLETDLSDQREEFRNHMFPVDQIFNCQDWGFSYRRYWEDSENDHQEESANRFNQQFYDRIIRKFQRYELPVIKMTGNISREAVCSVFEKVNTGGVELTVFELVTASFAAESDSFYLREDWETRKTQMEENYDTLSDIPADHFLQAISLLTTQKKRLQKIEEGRQESEVPGIGCQRRDILNLRLADYKEWADRAQKGFEHAARFLRRQYIYVDKDIPYKTQIIPLAALYAYMGEELEGANAQDLLEEWFWCRIFSESYSGSGSNTQPAVDLREMPNYIRKGEVPTAIREASFNPERLLSLRRRPSAAYNGVYALQKKKEAADWRTGDRLTEIALTEDNVEIHHIFPKKWCETQKPAISSDVYNSIINKTPIDAKTNRKIGGKAPSQYLTDLEKDIDPNKLDDILERHWIVPQYLREDNFADFFVERGKAMVKLIGRAMGKEPNLDDAENAFKRAVDED